MFRRIGPLLASFMLLPVGAAHALPIDRSLLQLKHTRWTSDEGAPDNITALAQSADGYLWIGSGGGLFRFDGQIFDHIATIGVENAISALAATKAGDLWIGLQNGHVLLLHDGHQTDMTPPFGGIRVHKLIEDRAGGIWLLGAGADIQVARYANGRWMPFAAAAGIPSGSFIRSLHVAGDGAVWTSGFDAVRVLRPGAQRFVTIAPGSKSLDDLVEDAAGRIWSPDPSRGLRVVATPVGAPISAAIGFDDPKNDVRGLMFDHDGSLWGWAHSGGLLRIQPARAHTGGATARLETFAQKDGLSSDNARAVLEDREHNIWVGTSLGLDRFRPANVVLETGIPQRSPYGFLILADHRGAIFVADSDTLYRVDPGGVPIAIKHDINNPQAMCEGPDGDLWLAATNAMYRVHDGVIASAKEPDFKGYFLQCQRDRNGGLWFLTYKGGFYRFNSPKWSEVPARRSSVNELATLFTFDTDGRRLTFYENLGLVGIATNGLETLWPACRISGERIGVLEVGADDTLAGTMAGLARIRGDRIDPFGATYPWLRHVVGIARTSRGDTWIQSASGIFQVPTKTLEAAFDRAGSVLSPTAFDAHDGLPGVGQAELAANSAATGADGRVWFTTVNGIVWIDPAHIVHNAVLPPVDIKRVIADGRTYEHPLAIDLPGGTKNLEIDFTALSLTMPERVAFRYKLAGVDDHWINPESRRQAFYAHLAPGSYRFTVIAANNDGVWNTIGASMKVTLPPTFLQSWVFKLLCLTAALLAIWVLYRLRLTAITYRLAARLDARLAERERIARELHDTLLQGVQGLILRFQGIADRLPHDQVPGRLMEKALDRAEELLLEGRERVHGLRSVLPPDNLRASLTELIDNADLPAALAVTILELGRHRTIDAAVQEELAGISREALSNVVRHARATAIEISLTYLAGTDPFDRRRWPRHRHRSTADD